MPQKILDKILKNGVLISILTISSPFLILFLLLAIFDLPASTNANPTIIEEPETIQTLTYQSEEYQNFGFEYQSNWEISESKVEQSYEGDSLSVEKIKLSKKTGEAELILRIKPIYYDDSFDPIYRGVSCGGYEESAEDLYLNGEEALGDRLHRVEGDEGRYFYVKNDSFALSHESIYYSALNQNGYCYFNYSKGVRIGYIETNKVQNNQKVFGIVQAEINLNKTAIKQNLSFVNEEQRTKEIFSEADQVVKSIKVKERPQELYFELLENTSWEKIENGKTYTNEAFPDFRFNITDDFKIFVREHYGDYFLLNIVLINDKGVLDFSFTRIPPMGYHPGAYKKDEVIFYNNRVWTRDYRNGDNFNLKNPDNIYFEGDKDFEIYKDGLSQPDFENKKDIFMIELGGNIFYIQKDSIEFKNKYGVSGFDIEVSEDLKDEVWLTISYRGEFDEEALSQIDQVLEGFEY